MKKLLIIPFLTPLAACAATPWSALDADPLRPPPWWRERLPVRPWPWCWRRRIPSVLRPGSPPRLRAVTPPTSTGTTPSMGSTRTLERARSRARRRATASTRAMERSRGAPRTSTRSTPAAPRRPPRPPAITAATRTSSPRRKDTPMTTWSSSRWRGPAAGTFLASALVLGGCVTAPLANDVREVHAALGPRWIPEVPVSGLAGEDCGRRRRPCGAPAGTTGSR